METTEKETKNIKEKLKGNPNRKQRRMSMKYLVLDKNLNSNDRIKKFKENIKQGNKLHKENTELINKQLNEDIMNRESDMVSFWSNIGYNETEIEILKEAFSLIIVKDKDNWKEDKKKARNLFKEARTLKNNR